MALIRMALSPGIDADAWVRDRVHQRPTPLSPLTFIVPGLRCGRLLRRGLAAVGYANVRTAILPQIAESLGAAALAREGLSPLTSATQDGAIRTSVRVEAKVFGATAHHPPTIRQDIAEKLVLALRAAGRDTEADRKRGEYGQHR